MSSNLKLIAVSFFTILILDMIWLGFVAHKFYLTQLQPIGRINNGKFEPIFWAAGLVYLFLAALVVYFVLPRLDPGTSLITIFLVGALMGFLVYGVYDMTNFSTLKDFSIQVAMADMGWGAVVMGLATLAAAFVRDL